MDDKKKINKSDNTAPLKVNKKNNDLFDVESIHIEKALSINKKDTYIEKEEEKTVEEERPLYYEVEREVTTVKKPKRSAPVKKDLKVSGTMPIKRKHSADVKRGLKSNKMLVESLQKREVKTFYEEKKNLDYNIKEEYKEKTVSNNVKIEGDKARINEHDRPLVTTHSIAAAKKRKRIVLLVTTGFSLLAVLIVILYAAISLISNASTLLSGENIDPYMEALYNEIEYVAKDYKVKYDVDIDRHLLVATIVALKDTNTYANKTPSRSFIASFFGNDNKGKDLKNYGATYAGSSLISKISETSSKAFSSYNNVNADTFSSLVDKLIYAENNGSLKHHIIIAVDNNIKLDKDNFERLMNSLSHNHQIFVNTYPLDTEGLSIIRDMAIKYNNINVVDLAHSTEGDKKLFTGGNLTKEGLDKASKVFEEALTGKTSENGSKKVAVLSNKEMKKWIRLLARYQIITESTCDKKSDTYREIASNDDDGGFGLFSNDVDKEKNYRCNGGTKYEVSTEKGFADDSSSGSVYYWNLMDEPFIENEYLNEYLDVYASNSDKQKEKERLIDYIYEYAEVLRQIVPVPKGLKEAKEWEKERDRMGGGNASIVTGDPVKINCPSINVVGYGNVDLEDYVAGVISKELSPGFAAGIAGSTPGSVKEGLKAFSIIVRTYGVVRSKECNVSIRPTTSDQVYAPTSDAFIKEIVSETTGLVLTKNGKAFSSEYDSYNCKTSNCHGDTCSCNYTYQPDSGIHDVSLPYNFAKRSYGGHGRGASQMAIIYLATQNKPASEILTNFYQKDVKISKIGG